MLNTYNSFAQLNKKQQWLIAEKKKLILNNKNRFQHSNKFVYQCIISIELLKH